MTINYHNDNNRSQHHSFEMTSPGYHGSDTDQDSIFDELLTEPREDIPSTDGGRKPTSSANDTNLQTNNNMKGRTSFRSITTAYKAVFLLGAIIFGIYEGLSNRTNKDEGNSTLSYYRLSYCFDSDDDFSNELVRPYMLDPTLCQCRNPLIATPRANNTNWDEHHKTILQDLLYQKTKQLDHSEEKLDFMLLGDSITEQWNGTSILGKEYLPDYRAIFDKYFNKRVNNNATLSGLALGASGDVSVELSWHLLHGVLSSSIEPKVFVVLIGTNDIGRWKCSKRTVLDGMKRVINILHTSRPNTPIIVHGLLPRSDHGRVSYQLGWIYNSITWINDEIEQYCTSKQNQEWCHYMNVNDIFIDTINNTIIKDLMDDALHPTVKGNDLWGPRLVDEIKKCI
jgi:lysophospholipase L1-like esterase